MATETTNLHLVKPVYAETADIAVLNDNFDKIDEFAGETNQAIDSKPDYATEMPMSESDTSKVSAVLAKEQAGLAIIVTGDTCTMAVPAGGYAYIKGNTHGLAEGLYRNKSGSSFPTSGGTANSSVFESVSSGGLNALKDITDTLNSNLTPSEGTLDYTNAFKNYIGSTRGIYYIRSGKVCIVSGYFSISTVPTDTNIGIANTGLSVFRETFFTFNDGEGVGVRSKIMTNGNIINEGLFKHTGWHSFSITCLLN